MRGYYQQFCFGALALCSAKQGLFGTNSDPLEQNRVCLERTPTRWSKTGSVWGELRPAGAKQGLFGTNSSPIPRVDANSAVRHTQHHLSTKSHSYGAFHTFACK